MEHIGFHHFDFFLHLSLALSRWFQSDKDLQNPSLSTSDRKKRGFKGGSESSFICHP